MSQATPATGSRPGAADLVHVTRRWGVACWSGVVRVLGAAAVALAVTGCGTAGSASGGPQPPVITQPSPPGPYRGLALEPPQPRPAFTLLDTSGHRFDFAARTRGRPTFLFFGYTQCPDVCPTTLADVASALRGVPDALVRGVQVVFVTTDPKRDTGPVLAAWLRHFDSDLPRPFVGLTGTVAQVEAAQAAARVPVAEDDGRTHSAELLLYGTDDYARVVYLNGSSPEDIQHDLPAVTRG